MVADESSMMSEESSFWGDDREQYMSDASENTRWSDVPSTLVLEQLSQELANRGSPESEVKLR